MGSDLCLVVSRIAGLHIWVRGCLSLMTSLVPRNCYRGSLIPRKKALVTSVTDHQTGYDLVKRFSMLNTVLDAGASPRVTRTSCDLRLTRPWESLLRNQSPRARTQAPVFSRILPEKRNCGPTRKRPHEFDNSYFRILRPCTRMRHGTGQARGWATRDRRARGARDHESASPGGHALL